VISEPFYIGKYEVTQAQFSTVMGQNPSHFKGPELPVECVSWLDAKVFCRQLSMAVGCEVQLPSEAQWEYACRAGTPTDYCAGNESADLEQVAWFGGEKTHPVGTKRANKLGLHDMLGNVMEWCEDDGHTYSEAFADEHGWMSSPRRNDRVVRGGAFSDTAVYCSLALRSWENADIRQPQLGFRIVMSAYPVPDQRPAPPSKSE
jgi:formylglycine-generating enzyme required for sulfatase activity